VDTRQLETLMARSIEPEQAVDSPIHPVVEMRNGFSLEMSGGFHNAEKQLA